MRRTSLAPLVLLAAVALGQPAGTAAAAADDDSSPAVLGLFDLPMPQQEKDFIAVIDKARRDYAESRSKDARQGARIGLQIGLHQFLGLSHDARDWIGSFRQSRATEEGNRSIEIEIAPGVTISTWVNDYDDARTRTMVRPYGPLASTVKSLSVGQPVRFSAQLIGSVISSDDDMILHPRVIAHFYRLENLASSPAP
jgi:hypothetical protein